MCMMKKVVIAGLAVAVGVAVLAWISPPLFDWIVHQGKAVQQGMEDSIPLEQRIDVLQGKLKDIEKNKAKYFDQAAKLKDEVTGLNATVAKMTKDTDAQWQAMQTLRTDLDTQKVSFTYKGEPYSNRAAAQRKLKQELDSYETAEKSLAAMKEQLEAKSQAWDAAHEQLGNLEGQNAEMEARLAQMRAELEKVKAREAQAGLPAEDNERASLKAEMDEVEKKIQHRETVLDLHAEFDKGHADAPADKPAEADVLKRFDQKAAEKDGTKTEVAGHNAN